MHFFYFEPEINSCKNISFQNIYFHSFGCFLNLWVTFFPLPGLLLFCFFFRVSFPRRKDSAEDYQTQIALIAGTNWKESIPGAKRICLPVQKLASVPYLTSSGKGAKKPRCCRPLNSALNHTLGRFLLDEVTADRACLVGGGYGGEGGAEKTKHPPRSWQERPRGKSSTKTNGNSAEQLMHSSVWLGQDLRDYKTLVEEEVQREWGLCCCCLQYFAQLFIVLNPLDWHWLRSSV